MSKLSDSVPDYTLAGINRYVENHIPPGGFLTAVLSNNLVEAFSAADENNTAAMKDIVAYIYWEIPSNCWGSPDKVRAWLNSTEDDNEQEIV